MKYIPGQIIQFAHLILRAASPVVLTLVFILSASPVCYSQTRAEAQAVLDDIKTEEEINYASEYLPGWSIQAEKLTLNDQNWSDHETQKPGSSPYILAVGDESFMYKLISLDSIKQFRVSYIFLDGRVHRYRKIDGIRTKILKQYAKGESFASLASKYSMDSSGSLKGGDLGWFDEKTMVPEFEKSIANHKKGDIFTVDSVLRRWYFVVLKTYEDRKVVQKTFAKIKVN
ncbi:MAG: hypothetical protein DWP94_00120 [Flavobacterium sp.]|nr:MAG: hypothetical protein DWP94_00120 [Flavobacterium sp.]